MNALKRIIDIFCCGGKQVECTSNDGMHDWSGPMILNERGGEASCKTCGLPFSEWAIWNLP